MRVQESVAADKDGRTKCSEKMNEMNYCDQVLEFWLPTKVSRVIAGLTIALVIAAIYLPEFLQKYDLQLSKEKTLLIRVSVPLLILWIGTFFVLFLVVQYSKNLKAQKQSLPKIPLPTPKPTQLPKEQINILIILSQAHELFTFQISQTFNISEIIVEYHLQELHKSNFIKSGLPHKPGRPWHITDKGRKYLIENKLIS